MNKRQTSSQLRLMQQYNQSTLQSSDSKYMYIDSNDRCYVSEVTFATATASTSSLGPLSLLQVGDRVQISSSSMRATSTRPAGFFSSTHVIINMIRSSFTNSFSFLQQGSTNFTLTSCYDLIHPTI